MRRILATLLLSLCLMLPTGARAGISCSLPFTLTNGTTADASQVMANYNAITACLATAAAAGSNTDITAILGLTTPLSASQGGTALFIGGTSTGSGNAQTIASLVPTGYTLSPRTFIAFTPGFTNTGPTTLTVNGTAATNVTLPTANGLVSLSGGEIVATQVAIAYYDGTQYQLIGNAPTSVVQPCTIIDYTGVAVPSGYLATSGQTISRTTFSNLFSCLAYTSVAATTTSGNTSVVVGNSALYQVSWKVGGANVTCNSVINSIPDGTHIVLSIAAGATGATNLTIGPYNQGDCSTTFRLPNLNGRMTAGVDTAGGTLSLTACPNNSSIGVACGSTTQAIAATNVPTISSSNASQSISVTSSVANIMLTGATNGFPGGVGFAFDTSSVTSTGTNSISVTSTGTNATPFLLQPVVMVQKAIKF